MYKIKLVGLFYSWYALKMIELKTSVLRSPAVFKNDWFQKYQKKGYGKP